MVSLDAPRKIIFSGILGSKIALTVAWQIDFPCKGFSTFVYLKVKLRSNNGSPEREPWKPGAREPGSHA